VRNVYVLVGWERGDGNERVVSLVQLFEKSGSGIPFSCEYFSQEDRRKLPIILITTVGRLKF